LAVPLFPFTGTWEFAYMWNVNCRSSSFRGYSEEDQKQILASTEKIYWPLNEQWTTDLIAFLEAGEPKFETPAEVKAPDVVEPTA